VIKEDDLAGAVLVAVPPWDAKQIRAFDRRGTGVELVGLDAEPPVETLE
jgi:hypothetical protein